MPRPRTLLTLALLAGLAAPHARAADAWPVPRGPSHEPDPYRYDPARAKKLPRSFVEDAVACVLYAGNTHLIEPDGTVETVTHEVTRLNGRKGIERLGEYRNITYDPAYQKLTLNVARIHKAGGRVLEVRPRDLQLRDVATDYQVYDHDKQLIISFPTLEVGDTIEVKWTVRGKNPEHGGRFFNRYYFGDPTFPVATDEFRVRLPRDKPFKYAAAGRRLEPAVAEDGDFRIYRWKATDCPRLPLDENAPPREELRPSVVCSTFASWEEVGAWKQRLRAGCWKCDEQAEKVVAEVTRGLADPEARARALTYWVRRNIRYVSTGEKHEYTPHPPAFVLANRFGDCKDTSQLLAVLLRRAGIPVALATLGVLDDGQVVESVPSPWGTHAILLVTIDGKEHWIDTTASLAGWDFLPRSDRDRLCYVVGEKGPLRLVRTPPLAAKDNRTEQTTTVHIGSDGSSRCERVAVWAGLAGRVRRDGLVEVPVGERRRQVTGELQDANSRTRLVRLDVDEAALEDYDRPVRARTVFDISNHFPGSPEREGSLTDSVVWNKLLAYTLDYERKVPLVLPAPFESHHRYLVHLPPAYTLDGVPRNRTVRSRWGEFSIKVRALNNDERPRDLQIDFDTRLDKVRVEVADFDAFRKFHEEVSRHHRVWLTLKPVQDPADAPLLEALLYFDPLDVQTAQILARLYQKQRQDEDARRVLRRALHYRPDDEALWELTAQVAATPKEEEDARRQLVRRFPKEPRHVLGLGAFLVGQGRQPEARALLEPLTRKGPVVLRAGAHYQLARSHYRRDELKPALEHLNAAARLDPESVGTVRGLLLKGQINEELGKLPDAARAYQEALQLDRDSEDALTFLIRVSLAQGNRPQALDYLRRYTVLVGDDVAGLLVAANYYLELGHYDDAFDLASRARDRTFHEKAQRVLGLVYLHRGDAAHAVKHLERAEADATVLEALIRAYPMVGDLRELPARLEQADRVDKPPARLRRTCERARALLARRSTLAKECPAPEGKESEWRAALDAVVCAEAARAEGRPAAKVEGLLKPAFAPGLDLGPAYTLRGRLLLEHGKLTRALADAERAIALTPHEVGGYYVRGRVRLERNAAGALADLEKAAALGSRKDADVLHALAAALSRAGRPRDAVAAQREAVKLRPADAEMAEQLRELERANRQRPANRS